MSKIYGNLELQGGQILNLSVERLSANPTFSVNEISRMYFNTTDNCMRVNDGSEWITLQFSNNSSNPLIDSLGTNWLNTDLSFDPVPFNNLSNISGLTSNSTLFNVIEQLDSAISNGNTLAFEDLTNVNVDNLQSGDLIIYNGGAYTNISMDDLADIRLNLTTVKLKDVQVNTYDDGDILIFSSGYGKLVNRKIYQEYTNLAANTTFVVAHTLGVRYCTVTPINAATNSLVNIGYTISYDFLNQFTIIFSEPVAVRLLIIGVNFS